MLPSDKQVGGDHYKSLPIQPSEFIYRNKLNWLEGNAIKYILRHHVKGGAEDLDKAMHYLELLQEWAYPETLHPREGEKWREIAPGQWARDNEETKAYLKSLQHDPLKPWVKGGAY